MIRVKRVRINASSPAEKLEEAINEAESRGLEFVQALGSTSGTLLLFRETKTTRKTTKAAE